LIKSSEHVIKAQKNAVILSSGVQKGCKSKKILRAEVVEQADTLS
jgi:hypothetical protein